MHGHMNVKCVLMFNYIHLHFIIRRNTTGIAEI